MSYRAIGDIATLRLTEAARGGVAEGALVAVRAPVKADSDLVFLQMVQQQLTFEMLMAKGVTRGYRPTPTADHLLSAIRLGGDFGNFITEIRAHFFAQWQQVVCAISKTEEQQREWFLSDDKMVFFAQNQVKLDLKERQLKTWLCQIDQTLEHHADDPYQMALCFRVMLSHSTIASIFPEKSVGFKQQLQAVFHTLTEGNFEAFIADVRRDQYCFKDGTSVFAAFLKKYPEMTGPKDQQAKKIMEFLASELGCTVEKLRYVADRFFNQGVLPQVIQGVITAKMRPKNREHFEVVLKSVEVELSARRGKIVATVCGKGVVFKHLAGVSAAYMPQFSLDVNIRCCFKSSGAIVFNDLELMGSAQDVLSLRQVLGCKDTALQERMILGLVEDRERRGTDVETDLWCEYGSADNFYGDMTQELPFARALWGIPTKESLEALFEGSDNFSVKPSPPPCPRLMTSAATNAPSKALVVCSMSVLDGLPIPKGFDISNPAHLKSFFLGLLGDGARVLKEPEDEVSRKLVFGASPEEEVTRAVSPITPLRDLLRASDRTPKSARSVLGSP